MWNVPPEKLCRKHLLGEHLEMHMFLGSVKKGVSLFGFIRNGLVNPKEIKIRHDALAEEMVKRNYNHVSPLEYDCSVLEEGVVDVEESIRELRRRCDYCIV
jgi:hypothetical protein